MCLVQYRLKVYKYNCFIYSTQCHAYYIVLCIIILFMYNYTFIYAHTHTPVAGLVVANIVVEGPTLSPETAATAT